MSPDTKSLIAQIYALRAENEDLKAQLATRKPTETSETVTTTTVTTTTVTTKH